MYIKKMLYIKTILSLGLCLEVSCNPPPGDCIPGTGISQDLLKEAIQSAQADIEVILGDFNASIDSIEAAEPAADTSDDSSTFPILIATLAGVGGLVMLSVIVILFCYCHR